MKIALPVKKSGQIDDHFGHCEFYSVFTVSEKGEITDFVNIESLHGCGCKSNIAIILAEKGVKVMLAGGIGGGAIDVLNNSGIKVIRGCSGNAAEVVAQFVEGKIVDSGESCAHHEHHHHNH